jgi:hypothetical protein
MTTTELFDNAAEKLTKQELEMAENMVVAMIKQRDQAQAVLDKTNSVIAEAKTMTPRQMIERWSGTSSFLAPIMR